MDNNAICEHCESIFVSAETQRKSVTSVAIREGTKRQNMDYKNRQISVFLTHPTQLQPNIKFDMYFQLDYQCPQIYEHALDQRLMNQR